MMIWRKLLENAMAKEHVKGITFKAVLLYFMLLSLSLGIKDSTGMEVAIFNMALINLLIVLIITIVYLYPRILGIIAIAVLIWGTFFKYRYDQMFHKIFAEGLIFFQWLFSYILGYAAFDNKYSTLFFLLFSAFSAIILAILVFSSLNKIILIVAGLIVFSFLWFIYVDNAKTYLILFLLSSLMLYSYNLWKKKDWEWKKSGYDISVSFYKHWILSVMGITIVSLIFMALMPFNIRPLKITFIDNFMVQTFPFISQWKNSGDDSRGYIYRFSLSNADHTGKKLGGPVKYDGSLMLSVRGNFKKNLYLRGAVKDKYSGFNWTKVRKKKKNIDSQNEIYSTSNTPEKTFILQADIKQEKLQSSTLFTALYPVSVKYTGGRFFADEGLELYSSKNLLPKDDYEITCKIPLISEEKLQNINQVSYDDLPKSYLRLPPNISDRLVKLVERLSNGKNNSYEIAKSIETYLRNNYKYTLNPPKVPEGNDFADYFVFEEKQGYCTYFATAMSVMLRIAGIPSRYVEGFLVKADAGAGYKTYSIIDSDAHAWVEAYIGQYGWMTFEPTPAYDVIDYENYEENIELITKPNDFSSDNAVLPHSIRDPRDKNLELEEVVGIETEINQSQSKKMFAKIFFYTIIFIFIIRIAYGFIRLNINSLIYRYNKKKYAFYYIYDIIWLLGKADYKKKDDQTIREYMDNVAKSMDIDDKDKEYAISVIEKSLYGNGSVEKKDREKLGAFKRQIKQKVRNDLGELRYYARFYMGRP